MKKISKTTWIVVLIAVAAGVAIWYYMGKKEEKPADVPGTGTTTPPAQGVKMAQTLAGPALMRR